jgi:hypothetical protein
MASGDGVRGFCLDSGQEQHLAKVWLETPSGTWVTTPSYASAVPHQAATPVPRLPRPAGRESAGSTRMLPRPSTPVSVIVSCFLLDTGRLLGVGTDHLHSDVRGVPQGSCRGAPRPLARSSRRASTCAAHAASLRIPRGCSSALSVLPPSRGAVPTVVLRIPHRRSSVDSVQRRSVARCQQLRHLLKP